MPDFEGFEFFSCQQRETSTRDTEIKNCQYQNADTFTSFNHSGFLNI
jgi:hypothetical protein